MTIEGCMHAYKMSDQIHKLFEQITIGIGDRDRLEIVVSGIPVTSV